ncbi:TrkH family potassium uptake protein [Ancylobacter dichloromethanicus]|uniref:Trk system potassium uptake protein n=1 Tax=Ancylobacter dichloromethanicus TaxID=518825 RepID=A0A9W6J8Z1_9HYPH|nr:potassium transporter TrkG [Ancylobacter dichloromethanicus]MBS7554354.1 TrkH family potassium uptake protein [Ancylobacter dichloromethanicus]GLK71479.1 Trk system potassium uptake protein [Ancylobacter dichloromethanicus]
MIAVARYSAQTAGVMAGFLLLSALVSLFRNEPGADIFLMTALLTVFGAGAVYLAVRHRAGRLDRLAAYGLLLVLWIGVPVVAAVPIAATTSLSPLHAWLEAVSAFTTTGPVQIHAIENVPRATLGWLLTLQWAGGLLSLVGFVAVLGPAGMGGLPDRSARADLVAATHQTTLDDALRLVLPIYLGATILCTLTLFLLGVRLFEALGLAGAALSTGGLLPDADGIAAYGHFSIKAVLIVFMLVGGTSVLWHRMLLTRRIRNALGQYENIVFFVLCGGLGLAAAAIGFRAGEGKLSVPLALEDGLFAAVSLVTTSGIEPHGGAFASLPVALVLAVIFVGGASFSTAGGIKIYRAGIMVLQSLRELERLVHPSAVHPRRLGQQNVTLQMMKAIWIMFGVACSTIAALTVALAPSMPSFEAAFVAVMAALSNVGPVYTAGWQPEVSWPDWGALPAYAQIILALAMILGRLEILVVLGLANFALWRR